MLGLMMAVAVAMAVSAVRHHQPMGMLVLLAVGGVVLWLRQDVRHGADPAAGIDAPDAIRTIDGTHRRRIVGTRLAHLVSTIGPWSVELPRGWLGELREGDRVRAEAYFLDAGASRCAVVSIEGRRSLERDARSRKGSNPSA